MAKNGNKEGIVELWGHEFNLAKNGLDEDEVVSFVNELIGERDLLTRRLEHMSSLTKLAEKTIVEADRLAGEIKKESTDQAKAEANAIVAKAEEQARQMIEEKRTESIAIATEEAKAIKANAERKVELLLEREREKIQPEIRDTAQRLYKELLSQLESLKQQTMALQVEFEHKLSQSTEETDTVTIEEEPAFAQAPANMQAEDISAESQQPIQPIDQPTTDEVEEKAPLSADSQDTPTYENEVELEVLPPIDIKQIMGIMRYLDGLAEVENTELIPLTDRPLIIVSLREPMQLIDVLRTLPEVDEVKEVTDGDITTIAGTAQAEGMRKRIQLRLSGNSELDDTKERLSSEVYHTLSS